MTLYESLIKVDVHAPADRRAVEICEGLQYIAVILIDEYGLTLDDVEDALDNARQAAADEWDNLHPSDGDEPDDD